MKRTFKRWLGAAALALGLGFVKPESVAAVAGITVDSIKTYPTYHNVGVRVYYSGDDDSNSVCTGFVWKPNVTNDSTSVKDTMSFYRVSQSNVMSSVAKRFWATSIMWNGQDTTVKFDVAVTDAGGCTNCPKASPGYLSNASWTPNSGYGSVQTWKAPNQIVVGKQIWMGPYGDDLNSGLDAAHPKRTFNGALTAMTTAGDQLRLLSGTYYTMLTDSLYVSPDSKNGAGPNARYSVVGEPGVVISGADTVAINAANWVGQDMGGGIVGYYADFSTNPIWPRGIVIGDTARLYPYQTQAQLAADSQHVLQSVGGAFWVAKDGKTVIIRPGDHMATHGTGVGDPLSQDLDDGSALVRAFRKDGAFRIESAFWRIDSLTFRDFGAGIHDNFLTGGPVAMTNQGGLIENCVFKDNGRPPISFRYYFDGTQLRTHGNTVQYCQFLTHTYGQTWGGAANLVGYLNTSALGCTAGPDSLVCNEASKIWPGIFLETGRGHVIRWNTVRGGSDSFVRCPQGDDASPDTLGSASSDCDVYQNDILNMGDDVIEPDGTPGINNRVYKNLIRGGHTGFNWFITVGPFYFVYNTLINTDAFVLPRGTTAPRGEPSGHVIIANNTAVCNTGDAAALWAQPQNGVSNQYRNVKVYNNLLVGKTSAWYEAGSVSKNEFNFNGIYVLSGTGFSKTNYSTERTQTQLTAWRDSSYTQGKQDRWLTSLLFADTTRAGGVDYSPTAAWTKVFRTNATDSAGRSMPGINTNIKHAVSSWKNNTSGSSDSTYYGAWKVNGMRLEGLLPAIAVVSRHGFLWRFFHLQ